MWWGKKLLVILALPALNACPGPTALNTPLDEPNLNGANKIIELNLQRALEIGGADVPMKWEVAASRASGEVVGGRVSRKIDGLYCRQFTHRFVVRGKSSNEVGTACRSASGEWVVMNP